jgi:hypothetical protein
LFQSKFVPISPVPGPRANAYKFLLKSAFKLKVSVSRTPEYNLAKYHRPYKENACSYAGRYPRSFFHLVMQKPPHQEKESDRQGDRQNVIIRGRKPKGLTSSDDRMAPVLL